MKKKNSDKKTLPDISIEGTLPHQINAPDFKKSDQKIQKPFINEFGVVIGDSFYDSAHSPLNQWSTETDPSIMAGDQWVHPTNDIGWNTSENREILENKPPKGTPFTHPTQDSSYGKD